MCMDTNLVAEFLFEPVKINLNYFIEGSMLGDILSYPSISIECWKH